MEIIDDVAAMFPRPTRPKPPLNHRKGHALRLIFNLTANMAGQQGAKIAKWALRRNRTSRQIETVALALTRAAARRKRHRQAQRQSRRSNRS